MTTVHPCDDPNNIFFREIPQFTQQMNSLLQATATNQSSIPAPNELLTRPYNRNDDTINNISNIPTYHHYKKHSTLPIATNSTNTRSIYDNVPDVQTTYYKRLAMDKEPYRKCEEPNGIGSRTNNTADNTGKDDQGKDITTIIGKKIKQFRKNKTNNFKTHRIHENAYHH